jgi:valyl-tRNA synthetase
MKELSKKYEHLEIESKWKNYWIKSGISKAKSNTPAYSIVLPPPNVTGNLHLGHAWNATIQDLLIRFKKLNGFNTCLIPGLDHAGIATQVKFERILKEKGIKKSDMTRSEFLAQLKNWAQEQKDNIRNQWSALGLMLDVSREKFTLDSDVRDAVNDVFIDMYKNKLIYRDKKLVNWDFQQQTSISNIEVIHREVEAKLYKIKYYLQGDSSKCLLVATTRPETMFGDVALVVNPSDKRYTSFVGLNAINPANNKPIPVITDSIIDIEFGTGVVKCTPAHDFNDNAIGIRNKLEMISIMNIDGTLNEHAGEFKGLDRFVCRQKLVEKLSNSGHVKEIENYKTQIGYSERSDTIVEPILSTQWFLSMKPFARRILKEAKKNNFVNFHPIKFKKTLLTWIKNIEDWVISRQLWWGHQIPAWYNTKTKEIYVGKKQPTKKPRDWVRDQDVLDTWFSSSLWPLVTTDFYKKNSQFNSLFFPTSVLVTAYDIIFFWVARMIFQSYYISDKPPFKTVLIHGLVRDANGKKMSKSLGNIVNPLDVIKDYGADSLRMSLISFSTLGEDLKYNEDKVKSCWNFINKLWNSARFLKMNSESIKKTKIITKSLDDKSKWILNKINKLSIEVKKLIDSYNFVVATKKLTDFVWNDFCNTYIELCKPDLGNKLTAVNVISVAHHVLNSALVMLHPLIPYVTEEIYQSINGTKKSIALEKWPQSIKITSSKFTQEFVDIIEKIRKFKWEKNIPQTTMLSLNIQTKRDLYITKNISEINKMLSIINCEIKQVTYVSLTVPHETIVNNNISIQIPSNQFINTENEAIRLNKELEVLKKEIARSESILSNENFLLKANKSKIDEEKQKYAKYKEEIMKVEEAIRNLK